MLAMRLILQRNTVIVTRPGVMKDNDTFETGFINQTLGSSSKLNC